MRPLQERVHADAFLDDLHAHVSANSRSRRIASSFECRTLGNVKLETDRADEMHGRDHGCINPTPAGAKQPSCFQTPQ
jgi:hypothetical protein